MKARDETWRAILHDNRLHCYQIPQFQREYQWTQKHWDLLYDDITGNDEGYFIGALIFINASDSDRGLQRFTVVDGQQRLATLSIWLAAIHRLVIERQAIHEKARKGLEGRATKVEERLGKARAHIETLEAKDEPTANQEHQLIKAKLGKSKLVSDLEVVIEKQAWHKERFAELVGIQSQLKTMLLVNDADHEILNLSRLTLSTQGDNHSDYEQILLMGGLPSGIPDLYSRVSDLPTKGRLFKAFRYLYAMYRKQKVDSLDIVKLFERISSLIVVDIKAESNRDAYILFESLNNRGEPLSVLDLVKNRLLGTIDERASKKPPESALTLDQAFSIWKKFVEHIPEVTDQDRFLRHFYLTWKHTEEIAVTGFDKLTGSQVVDVFHRLIERKPDDLVRRLESQARVYAPFVDPSLAKSSARTKELWLLRWIGATPGYVLLLYVLTEYRERKDDLFLPLVSLVQRFFARRHIAGYPGTQGLERIFVDLKDSLVKKHPQSNEDILALVEGRLREEGPDWENVQSNLGLDAIDNASLARALLIILERSAHDEESVPPLWDFDSSGKPWFTLEHIMPRKLPEDDESWPEMIREGNAAADVSQIHEENLQLLGNLTLTTHNREMSNKPFADKKKSDPNHGWESYDNGFAINSDVAGREDWTPSAIDERTWRLAAELGPLLAFDGEEPMDVDQLKEGWFDEEE